MRSLSISLLFAATLAVAGCAPGMSAVLQVRSAPAPPAFEFHGDPHFHYLPYYDVSVIDDDDFGYDLFSCDGLYYLYSGGYWYRSGEPRGPFEAIEARRVPRQIFAVDDRSYRWRSHPQGWQGRDHGDRGRHRGEDRGDRGDDHGDRGDDGR